MSYELRADVHRQGCLPPCRSPEVQKNFTQLSASQRSKPDGRFFCGRANLHHHAGLTRGKVVFHLKDGIRPTLVNTKLFPLTVTNRTRKSMEGVYFIQPVCFFTSRRSVTTGMPRPLGAGSITFSKDVRTENFQFKWRTIRSKAEMKV